MASTRQTKGPKDVSRRLKYIKMHLLEMKEERKKLLAERTRLLGKASQSGSGEPK